MPWIAGGGGVRRPAATYYLLSTTQTRVAAADERHADRRELAEHDHHFRDDDARRDHRDGGDAARHRRPAEPRRQMYDPEVSDGYILVGVENPADAARLEPALAIDGGRVKQTSMRFDRREVA